MSWTESYHTSLPTEEFTSISRAHWSLPPQIIFALHKSLEPYCVACKKLAWEESLQSCRSKAAQEWWAVQESSPSFQYCSKYKYSTEWKIMYTWHPWLWHSMEDANSWLDWHLDGHQKACNCWSTNCSSSSIDEIKELPIGLVLQRQIRKFQRYFPPRTADSSQLHKFLRGGWSLQLRPSSKIWKATAWKRSWFFTGESQQPLRSPKKLATRVHDTHNARPLAMFHVNSWTLQHC